MKKPSEGVIPSEARNLLLLTAAENKADSSVRHRTPDFGMTSSWVIQHPAKRAVAAMPALNEVEGSASPLPEFQRHGN
jgi:hypothetical protein